MTVNAINDTFEDWLSRNALTFQALCWTKTFISFLDYHETNLSLITRQIMREMILIIINTWKVSVFGYILVFKAKVLETHN